MAAKLVKIEDVSPGAKIAKDVTDSRGSLLFKAGVEVNASLLERLRARNISHVWVEEAAGGGLTEQDIEAKKSQIGAELDAIFAEHADKPLMMGLRDAAKRYLQERAGA